MSKRVVVYYSLSNNTKEAAETISKALGVECVSIHTVKSMPEEKGKQFMIGGMQSSFGMKPRIEAMNIDFDDYDEIILGIPVWASKCAAPINTFLSNATIRNKVTGVFTSSGGGDNDKCLNGLKKKLKKLTYSVALADRNNDLSKENPEKINIFVKEILNGKE